MLFKEANDQSGFSMFDDREVQQTIAAAEELADRELRRTTKRSNYLVKRNRAIRRRKNETN